MLDSETIIGVCGAGAMGAGIAQVAAQAGCKVIVLDQDETALTRGRASVEKGAGALLERGKISEAEARAIAGRITWTLEIGDLSAAGLIIEAVIENAEIKKALFAKLEDIVGGKTALATNTSSLSVTALAGGLGRPQRFLGLHFFNPAPVMKLVEVVSGALTDASLVEGALALMERWGKVAVKARDVPGFIVNRVARPYYGEGWRVLEEGAADAATLDFLYRDLAGFRMGPFELGDFIGQDINTTAAKSVFDAYYGRTRFTPSPMQAQMVAAGRLGRKSGRGVYDYSEGAPPPAPVFAEAPVKAGADIRIGAEAPAIEALLDACGAGYARSAAVPHSFAEIGGAFIAFTSGATASALREEHGKPVALLDWMRDPNSASAIAFAGSCDEARDAALQLAALCGKRAVVLRDRPGLVVFRTLLQLANCAADAVRDQVADAPSIDRAMINGVNYPFGPMMWARDYGFARVVAALDAIAEETGEALYRPSEVLRALARRGS